MDELEKRFERLPGLEKWFVRIRPIPPWFWDHYFLELPKVGILGYLNRGGEASARAEASSSAKIYW
jgi:hypothetical protein